MSRVALAGSILVLSVMAGGAQTPSLNDTLTAARRPIVLRDGRLEGAGADLLRAALNTTPYVLIGEDHGLAEIPAFSAAVFRELASRGMRDLVLEVGPEAGRRLTRVLNAPDPEAEVRTWVRQYPFSLAFYDLVQEFDFLRQARAAAGPGLRVTGVDQELMGASRMLLDSVGAKDADVADLVTLERQAYGKAHASGTPLDLFMLTGPADTLEALRDRLANGGKTRDAALVASLLDSRQIYALNA